MGVCSGCGIDFVFLVSDTCLKCKKREKASSAIERDTIDQQPQCGKCSVIYPFLKGSTCGTCERQSNDASGLKELGDAAVAASNAAAQNLLKQARDTQKTASQYRLHQVPRTLNAGLQAAAAKKESLSQLKKMTKATIITVEASLYIFPLTGAAAKKAQLLLDKHRWETQTTTATVLASMKTQTASNFNKSPPSLRGDTYAVNFADASFGIVKGNSVYQFEPTADQLKWTIEDMFNHLRHEEKLTDSDVKSRNISFRIYAYEASVPESDSDNASDGGGCRPSKGTTTATTINRRSSTAVSKKRKAATSISTAQPPRIYKSAFRPPVMPSTSSPTPEPVTDDGVQYATFDFYKTSVEIDAGGAARTTVAETPQTIRIAQGWQDDIGSIPKNGYIAKGLMKFAFLGQFEGQQYALFQSKPESSTEELNHEDLLSELSLLKLGQYFAESFAERARLNGVKLNADIRFNAAGAFVGKVNANDLSDWEALHNGAVAPLQFTTFLATPFLAVRDASIYQERKFSGTDEAGLNTDIVGSVVDAFAHHVVDDSLGYHHLCDLQGAVAAVGQPKEVILFDPQGNSLSGKLYFGDRGKGAILKFLEDHKCQSVCAKLHLKGVAVPEALELNRSRKHIF